MNNTIRGLYGVTIDNDPQVVSNVRQALEGKARVIQFRNKTDEQNVVDTAKQLRLLCREYDAIFLINDDLDLALAVDADGVHLGRNDASISTARKKIGDKIIGVSCYNQLALAVEAEKQGADYVAFGRFFPSKTKPFAAASDIELLRVARKKLSIPIVAIGGITTDNAESLIEAGADAIAVINGLFGESSIRDSAQTFSNLFR